MTKLLDYPFMKQRNVPNASRREPWAMSPNMTPKRKGKVTVVKNDGLAYLYRATP